MQIAGMTSHQERRDWFKIIRIDLGKAGITMQKCASICGVTPRTVLNWTEWGEPKDTEARILLALYRRFCPAQYHEHMRTIDPDYENQPIQAAGAG